MKTPTWAVVIGICLIVLGGFSVLKNIQHVLMPNLLEMQKNMLNKVSTEIDSTTYNTTTTPTSTTEEKTIKSLASEMENILYFSDFTKKWIIRFGFIGFLISTIYILSGVFLLIRKSFAIKFVYFALTLSIFFDVIRTLVLYSDSSAGFVATSFSLGNVTGIVIDIILLIVIISIDKSDYLSTNQKNIRTA